MKKQNIPIEERTFVRGVTMHKGEYDVTITSQPYVVGMYVAINDNKLSNIVQLNIPHDEYPEWVNNLIVKFKKDDYYVKLHSIPYTTFLSKEDIIKYEILKP